MDGKGQVVFVSLMIALVFIILALAFSPVLKEFTDDARNTTSETQVGLDCTNSSISDFDRANCLFVDYMNPLFVGFLIFAAGAIAVGRLLL